MQITGIRDCGSPTTLRWAIAHQADVKTDVALQSVVNTELCYLVTVDDINFLQLFYLTKVYRDKLRILDNKTAAIPTDEELHFYFPGDAVIADGEEPIQISTVAKHACTAFFNVALQMNADNDVIQESTSPMYLPMLSRKFRVQIPLNFSDMVSFMSAEEAQRIYTADYPITLQEIVENPTHGVIVGLTMQLVKMMAVSKYNDRYEKYLQVIKYKPLQAYQGDTLFKVALIGFSKYDRVLRGESRVSMFQFNPEDANAAMRRMNQLNTPLKLDVVVQMPIHHMQVLYNSFSNEDLSITYDSSVDDILDGGMPFSNFYTPQEDDENAEKFNNQISEYRTRITEANQLTVSAMNLAIGQGIDTDTTCAIAMLPGIYTAKAVITVDMTKARMFSSHSDPIIREMFETILKIGDTVINDINSQK